MLVLSCGRLKRPSLTNRGGALVEMAIVVVVLLWIVMGIVEFGFMFRNYLSLNEIARTGCRSAALGSSTSVISSYIAQTTTAIGLDTSRLGSPTMQYRVYDKTAGTWGGWQTLGNSGNYNNAPVDSEHDSQVKISLSYTYPLITGSFLGSVVGSGGNVSMSGACVMRREDASSGT